jgi:AcrR family transcriptional regulator
MTARPPAVAGQPGHRGRRASEDVEEAILSATLEILDESGFEGLTIEKVAARAGAAKTAVYRRWPSKVPLVVEALTRAGPELPVPDTGDLRTDIMQIFKSVTGGGRGRRSVERLLPVVTAYVDSNDELMALVRDRYFRPRLEAMQAVVARAAARAEIRAGVDPELAFDLLFGPLAYRWLRGSPPDDETIGRLVGMALDGLGPSRDPAR